MPILLLFCIIFVSAIVPNVCLMFKSMIYDSNLGLVDCTGKKCKLNGVVLCKFELIEFMRNLDFKMFWYRLMYAYDTMSYQEIYSLLEEYLSEGLSS